jgi:pimeloyl-ACP methyl ester carboxylesterase
VDGRPVRVFSAGETTDLPEVIMVPGLGAPGYLAPCAVAIARWTRVTILDLPGWRVGRPRSSTSTVESVAVAVARWLQATARRDIVLVGHSSGAQSALRTAHLVPDLISGLVLAGPTLDPAARKPAALLTRFVDTVVHEKLSELPAVLPWYFSSGGLPWLRLVRSAVMDRPEDRVQCLHPPVLVLAGDRDRFAPPEWAMQLAELASAECVIMPGPHNVCFTAPQPTAAALQRAIRQWTLGDNDNAA